jgi:hypothetical protein
MAFDKGLNSSTTVTEEEAKHGYAFTDKHPLDFGEKII